MTVMLLKWFKIVFLFLKNVLTLAKRVDPMMQSVNEPIYLLYLGVSQGAHRLEKYLNLEGFLEKCLKIKYALKSTGKSLKCLEKLLNSSIFCRT